MLREGTASPDDERHYYQKNHSTSDAADCYSSDEIGGVTAVAGATVTPTHKITACSRQQYNDARLVVVTVSCWAIVRHKLGRKKMCLSESRSHVVLICGLFCRRGIHLPTEHTSADTHIDTACWTCSLAVTRFCTVNFNTSIYTDAADARDDVCDRYFQNMSSAYGGLLQKQWRLSFETRQVIIHDQFGPHSHGAAPLHPAGLPSPRGPSGSAPSIIYKPANESPVLFIRHRTAYAILPNISPGFRPPHSAVYSSSDTCWCW